MKKVRSILGIILVLTMMAAFSIPAFAIGAPPVATIIVTPTTEGSAYEAHVILEVEESYDGSSISYSVNDTYESILRELIPTGDIIEHISNLSGKDLQQFADALYKKIKTAGIQPDHTAINEGGQAVFEDISPVGYTLIGQTSAGESEPFSVVMLDTSFARETIYVTPKTEKPTVEKKVLEKNDSVGGDGTWQDAADYDAGDKVAFQITATLPDNIASYDSYTVKFHDTLGSTLSYNRDAKVYAVSSEGEKNDITGIFSAQINYTNLTISCDDILQDENAKAAKSILVEYTASLSTTPIYGTAGNPNTVYMEYSRNPHGTETGSTTPDKVNVFSYQVKVDKVNADQQSLYGATFGLYKYNATTAKYEIVGNIQYNGPEFLFKGLDAGQYKLVEEEAPYGYNKIEPIEFQIEATYDTESADPALTALVAKKLTGESITGDGQIFAADLTNGQLATKIVNKTGSELPSTGGQGTFLLYVCGGGLVAVGGILLLLNKRRKSNNR